MHLCVCVSAPCLWLNVSLCVSVCLFVFVCCLCICVCTCISFVYGFVFMCTLDIGFIENQKLKSEYESFVRLQGCYKSCYQNQIIRRCGCADPRYPVSNNNTNLCDSLDPLSRNWPSIYPTPIEQSLLSKLKMLLYIIKLSIKREIGRDGGGGKKNVIQNLEISFWCR